MGVRSSLYGLQRRSRPLPSPADRSGPVRVPQADPTGFRSRQSGLGTGADRLGLLLRD